MEAWVITFSFEACRSVLKATQRAKIGSCQKINTRRGFTDFFKSYYRHMHVYNVFQTSNEYVFKHQIDESASL